MRKIIFKVLLSLVLILGVLFTYFITKNLKDNNSSDGTIKISIYYSDETLYDSKEFEIDGKDLFTILNENYKIEYDETKEFGVRLLAIDDIKTDFKKSYIAIYVDGKYSNYGISNISLQDKMEVAFKEQKL